MLMKFIVCKEYVRWEYYLRDMLHLFKYDMLLHCYIIYLIENFVIFGNWFLCIFAFTSCIITIYFRFYIYCLI